MNIKRFALWTCVLATFFCLLVAEPAEGQVKSDIERINRQITLEGLEWEAGDTSLSVLPLYERRLRIGTWSPSFDILGDLVPIEEKSGLVSSINWASSNGRNYITRIRDQKSCGACWAFAVLAAAEGQYNIEHDRYSVQLAGRSPLPPKTLGLHSGSTAFIPPTRIAALPGPDLSEQDLISCTTAGSCDGGFVSKAADMLRDQGVVSENCFPYEAGNLACSRCASWRNVLSKIAGWRWITNYTANVNAIKTVLQDGPVVSFMEVYDDFYSYRNGIYARTAGAGYEGGHAVLMVGYDDADNCWICKNSWGTNWGENGYFKIRRGNSEIGTFVLQLSGVTVNNRAPILTAVGSKAVKEGETITIQLEGRDPDNDGIT